MKMKSNVKNSDDEIEILDMPGDTYARVRIRERGTTWSAKASVFLGPDQLQVLAQECLTMARRIYERT
jgi:hypothetical protein